MPNKATRIAELSALTGVHAVGTEKLATVSGGISTYTIPVLYDGPTGDVKLNATEVLVVTEDGDPGEDANWKSRVPAAPAQSFGAKLQTELDALIGSDHPIGNKEVLGYTRIAVNEAAETAEVDVIEEQNASMANKVTYYAFLTGGGAIDWRSI